MFVNGVRSKGCCLIVMNFCLHNDYVYIMPLWKVDVYDDCFTPLYH